jgi:hypothetical protein
VKIDLEEAGLFTRLARKLANSMEIGQGGKPDYLQLEAPLNHDHPKWSPKTSRGLVEL